MAKVYYDKDVNWDVLKDKKVAVIGYGSQGHAHALNLKESGVSVVVGLYEGSKSAAKAEADGLPVASVAQAVAAADVTMVLIPDEKQAAVYQTEIAPHLKPNRPWRLRMDLMCILSKSYRRKMWMCLWWHRKDRDIWSVGPL